MIAIILKPYMSHWDSTCLTLVLIPDLTIIHSASSTSLHTANDRPHTTRTVPGTQRLVIRIYTSTERWRGVMRIPAVLPPRCDVVIVFDASGQRKSKLRTSRPTPPGILGHLAGQMKHRSWQAIPRRYTFVDAHTVDPWVFGFPEVALERDEMEDWRREALRRPQPNPRLYYDERHDLDADGGETIRFMSIGEYAPEAGPGELEEEVHGRYEAYPQDTGAEWVMEWKE